MIGSYIEEKDLFQYLIVDNDYLTQGRTLGL